jgi:high-affinity nickel-transport protein
VAVREEFPTSPRLSVSALKTLPNCRAPTELVFCLEAFIAPGSKQRERTMTITAPTSLQLALLSAAILGFRHGFDYDHIAAISDIASVPSSKRQAMRLGLLYALGHAATVAVLGSTIIFFQLSLPPRLDRVAERLVGATLIVLGIYVLGLLFKGDHVPRSRFALLAKLAAWLHWKVQKHWHSHDLPAPETPHWNYTAKSVFLIGVVHGLGAETPSQLAIFLLAAMGGVGKGFLGLAMFLAGLLAMNTLMTASAAGLFGFSARMPRLQFTITALTALYSLAVGSIFLLGYSTSLIPLVR